MAGSVQKVQVASTNAAKLAFETTVASIQNGRSRILRTGPSPSAGYPSRLFVPIRKLPPGSLTMPSVEAAGGARAGEAGDATTLADGDTAASASASRDAAAQQVGNARAGLSDVELFI